MKKELEMKFIEFDKVWCAYEQGYITELMAIESDARRFVVQAIIHE
jgi:hypothetical protein